MKKFKNIERNILDVSSPLTKDNILFPPAVVINLDNDKQRMVDFSKHIGSWGIHAARLPAAENVKVPATSLSVAETSCSLSHASAIRYMMLADDRKYMKSKAWLILEDDCRFTMSPQMAVVWSLINVPNDWSVISLGSYNKDRPKLDDHFYRLHTKVDWFPFGAHAYLVNPAHSERLCGAFASCILPVDHVMRQEFETGKGYLLRPSVAYQEIYTSNIAEWGKRKSVKHHADLCEDELKILIEEDEGNT